VPKYLIAYKYETRFEIPEPQVIYSSTEEAVSAIKNSSSHCGDDMAVLVVIEKPILSLKGGDVYRIAAARALGILEDQVTPILRSMVKRRMFFEMYGGQVPAFISVVEARLGSLNGTDFFVGTKEQLLDKGIEKSALLSFGDDVYIDRLRDFLGDGCTVTKL
jgi:hypothetical protein